MPSRIQHQIDRLPAPALVACLAVLAAGAVSAAPSNGQVAAGQATISAQGGITRVEQSSARAIINWRSFNVGASESVVFAQPSADALVLNRVTGGGPASSILGNLTANGRVFVVNRNGIVFGPSARVNVAGLVASAADIGDDLFMQGRYEFRKPGSNNARIVNRGSIITPAGGRVALLGPQVENFGSISADQGVVVLATDQVFLVDLFGDGLVQVATARLSGPPKPPLTQLGDVHVGSGTVIAARTMPELLLGTINSVDVAEVASHAEVLPGGTVAFVGSASRSVQSGYPTWLGPGLVPLPSGGHTGNGVIDATPAYSFNPTASGIGSVRDAVDLSVAHVTVSTLTGFNRLPEYDWGGGAQQDNAALYTVALPAAAASNGPQDPAGALAAPAPQQTTADPDRRYCTVQEIALARTPNCR